MSIQGSLKHDSHRLDKVVCGLKWVSYSIMTARLMESLLLYLWLELTLPLFLITTVQQGQSQVEFEN